MACVPETARGEAQTYIKAHVAWEDTDCGIEVLLQQAISGEQKCGED
jgi:hypothetical protein